MNRPYLSASEYFERRFGGKVYKLSLSASDSCPNRENGNGCIFCLNGSAAFAADRHLPVDRQIENEKRRIAGKFKRDRFIAYFGSYTNTYGDLNRLEEIFTRAANHRETVALSIGTRPDCLGDDALAMLERISHIKPIFVELGLQTSNDKSAEYIGRGYSLECYDNAVKRLHGIGANVITHMIIGLPFETRDIMLDTAKHIAQVGSDGIKLQLLHVLRGTPLADEYLAGKFSVLTLEEYIDILCDILRILPENTVIHRLTGDGDKKHLIAPMWSADKKRVLNAINKAISTL